MIPTLQGRSGVSGILASSEFFLPCYDLGSGAVNTTLSRGIGSATFTRATAAATKLSTGLWKLDVASGTARSCYTGLDTAVGSYGGYLAEGARTQLCLDPRDMTTVNWTATNVTPVKDATGIDGVANSACTLTCTMDGGSILQTLTAAASSRTYSVWLRRKTGTGTITISQGATTSEISGSLNASTYTLVQLNASVLNAAFGITFGTSGDEVEADCNQFEAGAFASTPIPAAGSRNADALTYTFAGNALTAQGAAYAELGSLWSTCETTSAAVTFTNANNIIPIRIATAAAATVIDTVDGTTLVTKSGLTSMATGVRKRASSWGGAGQVITGDGVAPATGAFDGDMGSVGIGILCSTGGGLNWFGTGKNIRIWQRQLTDNQLQQITA